VKVSPNEFSGEEPYEAGEVVVGTDANANSNRDILYNLSPWGETCTCICMFSYMVLCVCVIVLRWEINCNECGYVGCPFLWDVSRSDLSVRINGGVHNNHTKVKKNKTSFAARVD